MELTTKQKKFVQELLASDRWCAQEAARIAGYKYPKQEGYRLLQKPVIKEALGRAQRQREERCELKADAVIEYIRVGLFLNPLDYFHPTEDGKWVITDPKLLPREVGQLIESMKLRVTETDEETTSFFEVQLVSKAKLLELACKHLGLTREQVTVAGKVNVNWEDLLSRKTHGSLASKVEDMIARAGCTTDESKP